MNTTNENHYINSIYKDMFTTEIELECNENSLIYLYYFKEDNVYVYGFWQYKVFYLLKIIKEGIVLIESDFFIEKELNK